MVTAPPPTFDLSNLSRIVDGTVLNLSENHTAPISKLVFSSRDVVPGSLFVAVKGAAHDGHTWLADAFSKGATAAVVEDSAALAGRPGIQVGDSRVALSQLAAHFAGRPTDSLKIVGVTGTNGKTTSNWLICHALTNLGSPCARVGTLGMVFGGIQIESLTTPDPISLHSFLARAVESGATSAVLEVSSHGLDQRRADDIPFDVGIFTNLTRDHLDYHGTVENYLRAKMRLFELLRTSDTNVPAVVVNLDSEFGPRVCRQAVTGGVTDLSFGSASEAPVRIVRFTEEPDVSILELAYRGEQFEVRTKLVGRHNAENLCCAFCACVGLGFHPAEVAKVLGASPHVPGRLERVDNGKPRIFVDYAHTPDALERVITAVRPSTVGKLWVVFGCGGDRDSGKRPIMAAVARKLSDKMVVTSDNPRTESAQKIIDDILAEGSSPDLVEADRRRAIEETVSKADDNDTVLIAGKGHEDYQILGTTKVPFSDQDTAREALRLRGCETQ